MQRSAIGFVLCCAIAGTTSCRQTPQPPPAAQVTASATAVGVASDATPAGTSPAGPESTPGSTQLAAGAQQIKGNPIDLILTERDLPAGFQKAGGENRGTNVYSAVYVRPEALTSQDVSGGNLLGVIANLAIYDDAQAAAAQFEAQGSLSPASIETDIKQATQNATAIEVQRHDVQLDGTDQAIAYRVQYTAGTTSVFEYRYRVGVSNAVANVIVTANAGGNNDEPAAFRQQTEAILARQVARLGDARR